VKQYMSHPCTHISPCSTISTKLFLHARTRARSLTPRTHIGSPIVGHPTGLLSSPEPEFSKHALWVFPRPSGSPL